LFAFGYAEEIISSMENEELVCQTVSKCEKALRNAEIANDARIRIVKGIFGYYDRWQLATQTLRERFKRGTRMSEGQGISIRF
jgi:hypothetical protein